MFYIFCLILYRLVYNGHWLFNGLSFYYNLLRIMRRVEIVNEISTRITYDLELFTIVVGLTSDHSVEYLS